MFGRINELLIVSISQDHILLIFMKKTRTRETSPDNRGTDNQGLTVLLKSMHLVIVLVSRMQKSGTGNKNFCQMERDISNRPK